MQAKAFKLLMNHMKKVKITQVRSGIGRPLRQKRTLQALGLKKMHQTVEKVATPQILGMVAKVQHLVSMEESAE
jgi:large subunit ribosomal protein L30